MNPRFFLFICDDTHLNFVILSDKNIHMSKISFIFNPLHKINLYYKGMTWIFQTIRWGNMIIRPTSLTNDSNTYFKILILIIDKNKY